MRVFVVLLAFANRLIFCPNSFLIAEMHCGLFRDSGDVAQNAGSQEKYDKCYISVTCLSGFKSENIANHCHEWQVPDVDCFLSQCFFRKETCSSRAFSLC